MSDIVPADLSLPAKFVSYRRGQMDAILSAASSDKRFIMMSSPTGSGKSITYVSAAQMLGGRTLVVTGTKGLQGQLLGDFAEIGMVDIRGQNNYRCIAVDKGGILEGRARPGSTCDDGPCHDGIQCVLRAGGCHYYDAVARARASKLVVTNYRYWMTVNRYSEPFILGRFDQLVLDEAHSAPDELADFCSVRLERDEVRRLIDMDLPPLNEGSHSWVDWAKVALAECRKRAAIYEEKGIGPKLFDLRDARIGKMTKRYQELERALKELSIAHQWRRSEPSDPVVVMPGMQVDWVAEATDTGALFSPVWAHAYAEQYLFNGIKRIILTSATLQPKVATYLGITPADSEYREYASTFDAKRRPLIYVPTTTVDRHMTEGQMRVWMNKIDALIGARIGRKGIIHTRSYDRARYIMAHSKHAIHMMTHGRRNARDVVAAFKRRSGTAILVSPVMEEGYDFPGDECRYQIIAKVPFVDTRSLIMQARAKSDKNYLNYLTALSLIQMTGRGMRSESDWCETIIIDDHIGWFWSAGRKRGMFPKWFVRAFRRHTGLPPAMRAA